jgi:RNA polymerase sigma-70 factor (ECF subfamily)
VSIRKARSEAKAELARATDSELFAAMVDGDLAPLGELFDRYHSSVHAFAERLLANPADAADLVQETFLTASRAAASFQSGAAAKPFLLGVAAQLARRRRRSFARLFTLVEAFKHVPATPHATPEDDLVAREQTLVLDAALAKLSHRQREVLLMVDLGGVTGVDAARALGIPAGTVWRRLHEGRIRLRRSLKERSP